MTYHPVLSDTEHAFLLATLDLAAKHVGAQIANTGLINAQEAAGKLNAIRELTEKLNASKVEIAEVPASGANLV